MDYTQAQALIMYTSNLDARVELLSTSLSTSLQTNHLLLFVAVLLSACVLCVLVADFFRH